MQKNYNRMGCHQLLKILAILLMLGRQAIAQSGPESAIQNYKLGKYSVALSQFQSLAKNSPADGNLHYYMALCYQGLNKLSEASVEYQWVVSYGRDTTLKSNAQLGLAQLSRYSSISRAGVMSTSTANSASMPQAHASPPHIRDCLFSPKFNLKDGRTITAGKAWFARLPHGQTVLLSVLHLLGPAGGLESQIQADKVANVLQDVELTSLTDGSSVGTTNSVLSKTGYLHVDGDYSGDIIFFSAPAGISQSQTLTLADQPAAVGDRCWFYTCRPDENIAPQCFPGTVTESSAKMLEVKLDVRMPTQATSGSPILDRNGRVIGMLHGHFENSGNLICNPGCAIAKRIASDM